MREDHQRREAERDVDVEDPAPARVRGEEAADQRPGDAGDPEDAAEEADVLAALAGRDDVADRGLGAHHQPAAAEPLDRAERDQLLMSCGGAAERRTDEEEHQRDLEHALAPVEVAELAVERGDDRDRQQVGGDDPREVVEAAEVADDRRQRGRDDRLVERRQQHHQHQRADDRVEAAAADLRAGLGAAVLIDVEISSAFGAAYPETHERHRDRHHRQTRRWTRRAGTSSRWWMAAVDEPRCGCSTRPPSVGNGFCRELPRQGRRARRDRDGRGDARARGDLRSRRARRHLRLARVLGRHALARGRFADAAGPRALGRAPDDAAVLRPRVERGARRAGRGDLAADELAFCRHYLRWSAATARTSSPSPRSGSSPRRR